MYTSIFKPYPAHHFWWNVLWSFCANRNLLVFVHKVHMCIRRVHVRVRSYMYMYLLEDSETQFKYWGKCLYEIILLCHFSVPFLLYKLFTKFADFTNFWNHTAFTNQHSDEWNWFNVQKLAQWLEYFRVLVSVDEHCIYKVLPGALNIYMYVRLWAAGFS